MAFSMAQGGQFSHIQLDPSARTVIRRIRNMYDATPDEVREAGAGWYRNVHEAAAKGVQGRRGLTVEHGAGVIAAVSPNMDWETNNVHVFDEMDQLHSTPGALSVIRHSSSQGAGRTDEARDLLSHPDFANIRRASDTDILKASRIMGGDDYRDVLPKGSAPKTHAFATNIAHPDEWGRVTVDGRHADIITDYPRPWQFDRNLGRGTVSGEPSTRYRNYEGYTEAATRHINRVYGTDLMPHEVQAILWEHAKRNLEKSTPGQAHGDVRDGTWRYSSRNAAFLEGRAF